MYSDNGIVPDLKKVIIPRCFPSERMSVMFGFTLVLPLMLIIAAGNILKSRGFYNKSDIDTLTKTLYWIILPPLLFRTTFISGKEVLTQPNLLLAVNVCYVITIILAWIGSDLFFHRGNSKRKAVSVLSSIRANNIYLGFPVVQLAMGEAGLHEASVYIAVSTIPFQLLSLISAEIALSKKLSAASLIGVLKKLAVNPLVLSCGGGILLALSGLKELPLVFDESMKLMGEAATAIALLALGGTLDVPDIHRVFTCSAYNMVRLCGQTDHTSSPYVGHADHISCTQTPSSGYSDA